MSDFLSFDYFNAEVEYQNRKNEIKIAKEKNTPDAWIQYCASIGDVEGVELIKEGKAENYEEVELYRTIANPTPITKNTEQDMDNLLHNSDNTAILDILTNENMIQT